MAEHSGHFHSVHFIALFSSAVHQLDSAAEKSLSVTRFGSRFVCHGNDGTVTSHALNNPTIAVSACAVDTQRTTSKITNTLLQQLNNNNNVEPPRQFCRCLRHASGRSDLRQPG